MTLPLCFHENHNFSILLDTITKHFISGRFEVKNFEHQFSSSFSGLVYQLTREIYKFTFSIDWTHVDVPSHTTFAGTLRTSNNKQNFLDLEWLLINDKNESNIKGKSRLVENSDDTSQGGLYLPFPKEHTAANIYK